MYCNFLVQYISGKENTVAFFLSRLHSTDTDAPHYPRIVRTSTHAPQGVIKQMLENTQSPDVDILSLAEQAKSDYEYKQLLSTLISGQELSGPLSVNKPISQHLTVQADHYY